MGKMSREKGKRFEREVAGILRKRGFRSARRTAQYCGKTEESADVVGIPGYHLECKHQEKMQLYNWMDQAIRDTKDTDNIPVVIHRQNRKPALVTMRLDDFLNLVQTDFPDSEEPKKREWTVCFSEDGKVIAVVEAGIGTIPDGTARTVNVMEYTAERAVELLS